MSDAPKIKLFSFTIDCVDPHELAVFYSALLKWEMGSHEKEWAWIYPPGTDQGSYPFLLLQGNPEYRPPVWPDEPEAQQQMAHLDFVVTDLEASVQHAIQCGATVAPAQFSEQWRVMLDPAGHPFCLCLREDVFQSANYGLL